MVNWACKKSSINQSALTLAARDRLPILIHSDFMHPLWTTRPTEEDKHFHPPGIDCTRVKNSTVWDQQQQQQYHPLGSLSVHLSDQVDNGWRPSGVHQSFIVQVQPSYIQNSDNFSVYPFRGSQKIWSTSK